MRYLARAAALMAALTGSGAGAETLRSQTLEAEIARRGVTMASKEGASIGTEQVWVSLRRLNGQPVVAGDLPALVGFAEKAACGTRTVMVSLMVGAEGGAGQFEVLCARGE